uniref:Uncharacterized protein n=1 Tax=Vombatus ursinus TaxID=29139 RepID=A0A4X2LJ97_VOMUR
MCVLYQSTFFIFIFYYVNQFLKNSHNFLILLGVKNLSYNIYVLFLLQNCDLDQQSIVHIVRRAQRHEQKGDEAGQNNPGYSRRVPGREPESLTRVDLSSSILPAYSVGLAVILDNEDKDASHQAGNSGNFLCLYA